MQHPAHRIPQGSISKHYSHALSRLYRPVVVKKIIIGSLKHFTNFTLRDKSSDRDCLNELLSELKSFLHVFNKHTFSLRIGYPLN